MVVSFSHRVFVFLLRLTGGRKILAKQFAKGRSATAAPKSKEIERFDIRGAEFKGQPVWTYAGDDTLIYYLHGGGFILGFSPLYFPMMGKIAKASGACLVAPEQLLRPDDLRDAGQRYAGEIDVRDPLISPVFADSLQLPETHIFTGGQDPLHPDIIRFAARHPKAKIDARENMPHVYMLMPTKEAKAAISRIAETINA